MKRLKVNMLHRLRGSSPSAATSPGSTRPPTPSGAPAASSASAADANISTAQPSAPQSAWSTAWEGTKTILRLVRDSADAFPPLKSTAAGLMGLIDLFEVCTFLIIHAISYTR